MRRVRFEGGESARRESPCDDRMRRMVVGRAADVNDTTINVPYFDCAIDV